MRKWTKWFERPISMATDTSTMNNLWEWWWQDDDKMICFNLNHLMVFHIKVDKLVNALGIEWSDLNMDDHLKRASPLPWFFFLMSLISIKTTVLARPTNITRRLLHLLHYNLKAIFLVVLAFFLKIGLVCPPYPDCFLS